MFIALSVGALGFYIYYDLSKPPLVAEITANLATTTVPEIALGSVGGSGEYKVEVVNEAPYIPAPKLERAIIFPPSFSANAQSIIKKNIEVSISLLKKDAADIDQWLKLAIYRKMLNDYKGAEEIWIYLTKILKDPSYVYANLGDLYGYFLKEPVKAENYFKDAIRLESGNIEYYIQFAYFYLDVLKDNAKALALVEDGYARNSTRRDFRNLLKQIKTRLEEESLRESSTATSTSE